MSEGSVPEGTAGLPPPTAHAPASSFSSAGASLPNNNNHSTAETAEEAGLSSDEATSTASNSQESSIPEAQRWYRDPQWLYLRPQLQHMLNIGEFGFLVWKRKLNPHLQEYLLPVRIQKALPKPSRTVPGAITAEEVENLRFLMTFVEKFCIYEAQRYEQHHGHPCPPKPTQGTTAPASHDPLRGPSSIPGPSSGTHSRGPLASKQREPQQAQQAQQGGENEGRAEEEEGVESGGDEGH